MPDIVLRSAEKLVRDTSGLSPAGGNDSPGGQMPENAVPVDQMHGVGGRVLHSGWGGERAYGPVGMERKRI